MIPSSFRDKHKHKPSLTLPTSILAGLLAKCSALYAETTILVLPGAFNNFCPSQKDVGDGEQYGGPMEEALRGFVIHHETRRRRAQSCAVSTQRQSLNVSVGQIGHLVIEQQMMADSLMFALKMSLSRHTH